MIGRIDLEIEFIGQQFHMTDKEQTYTRIEQHYRDNYDRLVMLCNKYLHNMERAEDVVQEAYTRALTYWESVPNAEEEIYPWFQTILNNCIRENWKSERIQGMSENIEDFQEEIQIKASGIPSIILSQVEKRIADTPENVQKILQLFFLQQFTTKEIAELVPETANNIRVIVHRFREGIKRDFRWVI